MEKLPKLETLGGQKKEVFSVYGVTDLLETKYLVTVDSCILMGYLLNCPIYRISKLSFLPFKTQISKAK